MLNYLFIYRGLFLEHRAVVLSTVLTVTLNFSVLLLLLHRKVGRLGLASLIPLTLKTFIASVTMGLTCWVANGIIEGDWLGTEGFLTRVIGVFLPIGIGVIVLVGMYKALKVKEFDDIIEMFKRRLS